MMTMQNSEGYWADEVRRTWHGTQFTQYIFAIVVTTGNSWSGVLTARLGKRADALVGIVIWVYLD